MLLLTAGPQQFLLNPMYEHRIECAAHLERGLDPVLRRLTIENLLRILKHFDFDAIAFRGLSGALIVPTIAMMMDKTLLVVRKGELSHSSRMVEGDYNARRYVIVDDLVASGQTVKTILQEIHNVIPDAHCIGMIEYMYINSSSDPMTEVQTVDSPRWRT